MRYAYALTGALLLGGAAAAITLQPEASAQVAQNEPGAIQASAPRAGAPMSFADMVAKLSPAVVNISTKQTITVPQQTNPFQGTPFGDLFGQFGGAQAGPPVKRQGASLGSGFIISPDGYVVTNNHVIAAGAKGATVDSITVIMPDRKEYTARVIGTDALSDLAVLKINATNLPFVKFGDSSRTRVGDWVVAIGNPFGLGGTVTAGIVSALHRVTGQGGAFDRFIQTDAAINRGNSGGPMFDLNGNVIGINSQILGSETGGNIGIGFAIPAEEAKPIIDTFIKGGKISRGYIGVQIGGSVDDDAAAALGIAKNQGELIAGVTPGGPAAKGGLRAGDVVTKVNGQVVTPDQTLSYLVANIKPGATARFDIFRENKSMSLNVTAVTRPSQDELAQTFGTDDSDGFGAGGGDDSDGSAGQVAPATGNSLGLTVQPLTAGIARAIGVAPTTRGVVIAAVDPASDAGATLKRGDVVSSVNGTPVATAADVTRIVAQAKAAGRPQVLLLVQRGQTPPRFLAVKLKS